MVGGGEGGLAENHGEDLGRLLCPTLFFGCRHRGLERDHDDLARGQRVSTAWKIPEERQRGHAGPANGSECVGAGTWAAGDGETPKRESSRAKAVGLNWEAREPGG